MRQAVRQRQADPTLRLAMLATGGLALLVLVVAALVGQLRAGLEIDVGLFIGAANGPMIQRSVLLGARFGVLSLGRLLLLSVIGLGIGLALGPSLAWLVIAGIALAQLVLAGAGAWRMVRR
jgi:hypothetical protein